MKHFLLTQILVLLVAQLSFSQDNITGTIKDMDGISIPGASVLNTSTGVFYNADANGTFILPAEIQFPLSLKITATGFKTMEIVVNEIPLSAIEITLTADFDKQLDEVLITSRRRKENAQQVPIPISVISGKLAEDAGAFNVNRLKELVPSVQLYSSNPRNTGLSIRGMGTTFGLTNDGIDSGVGFYVDGVYYARPAATTLDFIDTEQIEVLRGPQGTLFGKNTTAGAFNITTHKPSFDYGATVESSYGNYGFVQAKASVTGTLAKNIAARFSFSGTQRDGLLYNVATQKRVNDLNNLGARAQFLYKPSNDFDVLLAFDYTRQRPDGYAQVIAGVAPTQRAQYSQFNQIIADLNYTLPSKNAFDRVIDHDTPWRSYQDLGGASATFNLKVGSGTLTSTTAWRFWDWDPSNDRDFTGLQGLALSEAPSKHRQWSQEVRWAGSLSSNLSGVFGVFLFGQDLKPDGAHTEEAGRDQWRFSQNSTSELWQTPGLLEGYGIKSYPKMKSFSGAVFGQLDWAVTNKFSILPGIRVNYDKKKVDFKRKTYGGLQTDDPALIALKNSVYNNQAFKKEIDDTNFSGQLTAAYKATERVNTFATFSTAFKPVGLNLGGLPNANGQPMTELAVIKPERVSHFEVGVKTRPTLKSTLNLVVYNTTIKDYQTQVQAADLSVNRGYLSNAEKVRVQGAEVDANINISEFLGFYGAVAYTDGIYKSFKNAPVPLEETGSANFKDISGSQLPGISKWAGSLGGEVSFNGKFLGRTGKFFFAADSYHRSKFSSSPSPSAYLVVQGYSLVNARLGFRVGDKFSAFFWGRNIFDKDYYEQLLPGAGNAGHYAGVLGDQRTYGITLRYSI
ncbi:TonB-dependent receptor [Flavobacterium psychrophilum]|nr:TonB-dependent receptor [Flavobacterium psychrophilum]AOE53122.1 TonB-dependent receptor [Flavobacterium psychrophilum]